jgi:hypothetical protein
VLSIGKLSSGATEYYVGEVATSAEDYYSGRREHGFDGRSYPPLASPVVELAIRNTGGVQRLPSPGLHDRESVSPNDYSTRGVGRGASCLASREAPSRQALPVLRLLAAVNFDLADAQHPHGRASTRRRDHALGLGVERDVQRRAAPSALVPAIVAQPHLVVPLSICRRTQGYGSASRQKSPPKRITRSSTSSAVCSRLWSMAIARILSRLRASPRPQSTCGDQARRLVNVLTEVVALTRHRVRTVPRRGRRLFGSSGAGRKARGVRVADFCPDGLSEVVEGGTPPLSQGVDDVETTSAGSVKAVYVDARSGWSGIAVGYLDPQTSGFSRHSDLDGLRAVKDGVGDQFADDQYGGCGLVGEFICLDDAPT